MNIKETLKRQESRGLSKSILISIILFLVVVNVVPVFKNFSNTNFIVALIALVIILLRGALPLFYQTKRIAFVANFITFALFVPNILNNINFTSNMEILDILILLINIAISIYLLLKMYAHFDELNQYARKPSRSILFIILLSLARIYFDKYFQTLTVFLLFFLTIILQGNARESLILSIFIFVVSTLEIISLIVLTQQFSSGFVNFFPSLISILFNVLMISTALKFYQEDTDSNYFTYE